MNEASNTLPPEWKECAAETVRALSIARHLATRHATDETPESVLMPALLQIIATTRACAAICNRIEGVYDALESLREPMLIERLAGIETELFKIANAAKYVETLAAEAHHAKGRSDGRK